MKNQASQKVESFSNSNYGKMDHTLAKCTTKLTNFAPSLM